MMASASGTRFERGDEERRRSDPARWYEGAWHARVRLWLLLGFLALVCLTGGSSRATVPSLMLLRPMSVIVFVALLCLPERASWRALRWPACLLVAWAGVIAVQLVPLPPAIWSIMPGHDRVSAGLTLLDDHSWRPISLFPDHSWSSLLDLLPPAILLVAFRDLRVEQRTVLLPTMLIMALGCALLGVAQMSAGAGSAFYLYSYATQDSPVGFFANRNHESVFLMTMLPFLRAWASEPGSPRMKRQRTWMATMLAILLMAATLVTGSRAGLVALLLCLVGVLFVQPLAVSEATRSRRLVLAIAGILGAIMILMGIFAANGRLPALSRLMNFSTDDELRFRYFPILISMIRDFFPFGTGFGSFEPMFRVFEPDAALKFTFFNNAHDDYIEILITGGLLAFAVLLAQIGWCLLMVYRAFSFPAGKGDGILLARASGYGIGIVCLASFADYPLRTPLFAVVATLWVCWLAVGCARSR